MKIIHDNIIFNLQKAGGISTYWKNLKEELHLGKQIININGSKPKKSILPYQLLRFLNFKNLNQKKFIFHSSYYRISKSKQALNVVTVHDFVYERYASGLKKIIHQFYKGRAIRNADKLICISENTRNDLLKFYPFVDDKKIEVIYHGVSKIFKPLRSKSTSEKKIIFVGSRSGYKNFNVLVQALKEYNFFELHIVGGNPITAKEKKELTGIKYKQYIGISDSELNQLYNESFALVYPSLYEGFGLPIVEALIAGCPVICNDGSSTGEIGDKYVLSGKIDSNFIISSLKILENKVYREQLIKKGIEYASKFTWEKNC